ncbi:hypothetical protein VTK26DRAFT_8271 [Humicola hyalothermophila]
MHYAYPVVSPGEGPTRTSRTGKRGPRSLDPALGCPAPVPGSWFSVAEVPKQPPFPSRRCEWAVVHPERPVPRSGGAPCDSYLEPRTPLPSCGPRFGSALLLLASSRRPSIDLLSSILSRKRETVLDFLSHKTLSAFCLLLPSGSSTNFIKLRHTNSQIAPQT